MFFCVSTGGPIQLYTSGSRQSKAPLAVSANDTTWRQRRSLLLLVRVGTHLGKPWFCTEMNKTENGHRNPSSIPEKSISPIDKEAKNYRRYFREWCNKEPAGRNTEGAQGVGRNKKCNYHLVGGHTQQYSHASGWRERNRGGRRVRMGTNRKENKNNAKKRVCTYLHAILPLVWREKEREQPQHFPLHRIS